MNLCLEGLGAPHQLTTPVAYITNSTFNDPFTPNISTPNDGGEAPTLRYLGDGDSWILASVGPDKKLNISLRRYLESEEELAALMSSTALSDAEKEGEKRDLYIFSDDFFAALYDPTNGTVSSGDIVRSFKGQLN